MQKLSKELTKKLIYEAFSKTVYVDKEEDSNQFMVYRVKDDGEKELIRSNMSAEETKKELESFSDIEYSESAAGALDPKLSMGGYDKGADFKAASIQRELVDMGHDLGNTGPNNDGVDGFFGPVTLDAWKEATGQSEAPEDLDKALGALKASKPSQPAGQKLTTEVVRAIIQEEVKTHYGAK